MSLQDILEYKIPHKPILFNEEMVISTIAGLKTQTRRDKGLKKVSRLATTFEKSSGWPKQGDWVAKYKISEDPERWEVTDILKCPFGKPGDLLWVRETWSLCTPYGPETYHFGYKAGGKHSSWEAGPRYSYEYPDAIRPSIHMPKEAARIWLRIKDVRVERLNDISEQDALAEGLLDYGDGTFRNYFKQRGLRWKDGVECLLAKGSFQSLWESIIGPGSWKANPWVWVIEFEVLSTDGAPSRVLLQSFKLIPDA